MQVDDVISSRQHYGNYNFYKEATAEDNNMESSAQRTTYYANNASDPFTMYSNNSSYETGTETGNNQYYAQHQSDKSSSKSNLDFLSVIPSSITVTKEKVKVPSPVKKPEVSEDFFNIRLERNIYGSQEVKLDGNQKLFIKTIQDEVLSFFKTYKVPLKSLCLFLLNTTNEKDIAGFFNRTDWNTFNHEEKLLYHRLNDWVSEPVTSRVYDLIQKETDFLRRDQLTKLYNSLSGGSNQDSTAENIQENVGMVNTGQNQDTTFATAGPPGPRSKTTEGERRAIKDWAARNPNASIDERRVLAARLGLAEKAVDRLFYYHRNNTKEVRTGRWSQDHTVSNNEILDQKVNADVFPTDEVSKKLAKVQSEAEKMTTVMANNVQSQNNSKTITDAIKSAIQSGTLKGVNLKKPLKIVVMPSKNKQQQQGAPQLQQQQQQQKVVQHQQQPRQDVPEIDTNNKYNKVALSSYFKDKPFPTEEEINYFVKCTKVPYQVTKQYVEKMQEPQYNNADVHYIESKRNSSNVESYSPEAYTQVPVEDETPLEQRTYPEAEMSAQSPALYPPGPSYQQPFYQNSVYTEDIGGASGDSAYQRNLNSHQEDFQSEKSGGLIPGLSEEQKGYFLSFIQKNPYPEMQAIMEFAKEINMAFENVLLILELEFNVFNTAPYPTAQPASEPKDERAALFESLDPEVAQLLGEIHDFKAENFPPLLESELKSMFGQKIFVTLDNVKSFAGARSLNFSDLYKKLNSNSDLIQLVSDETCKR